MVSGRSTTRYPLLSAPMSSSEDWYWGWVRVTPVATSTRIARNPKEVSVTRCPVSTDTSQAKNRVPSRRTGSVEPFVPSRRDPVTKSASPVSNGSSSSGSSVTSYWPSASVVTTYRAPRAAARWYPRRSAAPWPRFTGTSTVTAPCARATAAVSSVAPSTTTRLATGYPPQVAGTASSTAPSAGASLYAAISTTTGGNASSGSSCASAARSTGSGKPGPGPPGT